MKAFFVSAWVVVVLLIGVTPLHAVPTAPRLSAAALYNQGNAYARAGKPGMAVLNYERAQLLTPGDADLAANLDVVRTAQHLSIAPRSWFTRVAMLPRPTVAALAGLLGLVLLGFSVVVMPRLSLSRKALLAGTILGVVLIGLPLDQAVVLWPSLHASVVIAHEAPARVSPVPMGEALFVLPEAETVTLTAEHDDYVLIKTDTGRMGWVLGTNLARVVAAEH
jgi:hypothetical protein